MTDLRTAAQAVIALYDYNGALYESNHADAKSIEALRQALAAPVEPVAVVFEEFDSQVHYIETIDNKLRLPVGTKLYTTPPSVDALIGVDELANIIRAADGNHSLGAGALAEKIIEAIRARGQK